jgi:hypothetical protein
MECLQEGAHNISISTPNMLLFWQIYQESITTWKPADDLTNVRCKISLQ